MVWGGNHGHFFCWSPPGPVFDCNVTLGISPGLSTEDSALSPGLSLPQQEEVKGFCQPARDGVGLEQGWEELQIWREGWNPTCGKWRQDLANIFIVEPTQASNGVIPSHFCIFETTCFSSHLLTSAFCSAWYSSLFFPYHLAYAFYAEGQRMGTNSFWNQAELLLPFFPPNFMLVSSPLILHFKWICKNLSKYY